MAEQNTSSDAWLFRKKKAQDVQDSQIPAVSKPTTGTGISSNADYYNMSNFHRGKAIIFNHYQFDDAHMNKRSGTELDAQNMSQVLRDLKFDVTVYNDLKYGALYEVLKSVAAEDHSGNDCLLITVMSHGDTGVIHARDHSYPPDMLWSPFAGDVCPTLAGKPKIFFIQACRGEELDKGVTMKTATDVKSTVETYVLPAMADFLIMYSTTQGHYSFRSPSNGAWLIQALCEELPARARKQDLMTILTFVNRTMAIDFQSNVPGNSRFHKKKQVGSIVSSLTRLLYFYKEEGDEMDS